MMSGILLHHDNAPSHSSRVILDTIKELDIEILPHAPYSPDLAICNFWLFPNLKNKLRDEKYESREELRRAVDRYLRDMSRDGLHHVFRAWVERWDKCKLCKGRYFEKEMLNVCWLTCFYDIRLVLEIIDGPSYDVMKSYLTRVRDKKICNGCITWETKVVM